MLSNIIKDHLTEMKSNFNNWLSSNEAYYVEDGGGFVKDLILNSDLEFLHKKVMKSLSDLNVDEIIAFRALSYHGELKLEDIGICWSLSEKWAYCYGAKNGLDYFYKYHAKVPKESIDWFYTIQKALSAHSHEREIGVVGSYDILKIEKRRKTTCVLLDTYNPNSL